MSVQAKISKNLDALDFNVETIMWNFSCRSAVGWSAWLGGRPCEKKTNNQENRYPQQ